MGEKTLFEAYLLALTPMGFFGGLHFYLNRPHVGFLYLLTFGVLGIGYLVDIFRTPMLVKDANLRRLNKKDPTQPLPPTKFISDAYLMWFPLGIFGLHHLYLRRTSWALLYAGTFGLLAVGWIVDGFWLVSMVREAKRKEEKKQQDKANGRQQKEREAWEEKQAASPASPSKSDTSAVIGLTDTEQEEAKMKEKELRATVALGASPLGLFGAHHYYLRRYKWGALYSGSLGLLGTGWIFDWFRLFALHKRTNAIARQEVDRKEKTLDDAYVMWFPWGLFGFHHFYLGRFKWGFIYLFTVGVFTIGWLMDGFRLPSLVKETNQRRISHDSDMKDVEANITPAADDYDDNSLTLDIAENTDDGENLESNRKNSESNRDNEEGKSKTAEVTAQIGET